MADESWKEGLPPEVIAKLEVVAERINAKYAMIPDDVKRMMNAEYTSEEAFVEHFQQFFTRRAIEEN